MGAEVAILDDIVMAGGEGSWKREIGGKRNVEIQRERERERAFINDRLCVRVKNSEIICSSRHAIACVAMGRGSNSNSSHL